MSSVHALDQTSSDLPADGSEILQDRNGQVAVLTLNRPRARNAIHADMALDLARRLDFLDSDPDVNAVLLQGAGGAFCAGGDVKKVANAGARTSEQRLAALLPFHRLVTALTTLRKPLIAAVDGIAYGAGFSILLMADLVLLSERARLCMVFQRIGLLPDMGALHLLPRAVGLQRARELFFSAREIDADEAHGLGLALEVVPADDLAARALAIARSMAGASPLAVSLTKQALGATFHSDMAAMLAFEAAGQAAASGSDYVVDALHRYANRQQPRFNWAPS